MAVFSDSRTSALKGRLTMQHQIAGVD